MFFRLDNLLYFFRKNTLYGISAFMYYRMIINEGGNINMKMKKVLAIGLLAAMIMSVTSGTVTAADLDAEVVVEDFSDDVDEDVVSESEVEENDSDQVANVEIQDEDTDVQQTEDQEVNDDDITLFSDGEECRTDADEDSRKIIDSGDVNANIKWTLYDGGELVIEGNGDIYHSYWEKYKNNIKSIVIKSGITNIGTWTFAECESLESIQIPESVTSIGDNVFYKCKALKNIQIPKSVTSIGQYAFAECESLESIEIPEGVTSIEKYTFYRCEALQSAQIPKEVTNIGDWAFYECKSLKDIEIPESVTNIGEWAFSRCSSIKSIKIPEGVTCINDGAFSVCTSLVNVEIPNSVTKIGNLVFNCCINLTSVEIPESVTTIGYDVFYMEGEGRLAGITVPKSITKLEKGFNGSAKVIRFTGTQEEWENIYEGDYSDLLVIFNYKKDPNHEHLYFDYTIKNASCTEDGEVDSVCGICGKIGKQEIIPKSHSWKGTSRIDATCTTEGKISYVCDVCQVARKEEILPALGHMIVKETGVAATCTKDGLTEGSHCSVCGEVLEEQKTVPATGHKFSSWETISQATVFSPEQQLRSCSVCGKSENREVGNKLQRTMTVSATSLPLKTKQKTTVLRVSGLAVGDSIISWKSSNTKVAKVSGRANGTSTITAGNKKGTAKITITLKSGLQKVVKVTVQKSTVKTKKITGVSKSLKLNKKQRAVLRPVIAPLTSKQKITYKSSNSKVASVNSKGQITAKKKGTAVITVKSGSKTVKCKVTVK